MNNRLTRLQYSALRAFFEEHDKYMDQFFADRSFLENPESPRIIKRSPEIKESEFKLTEMKKTMQRLTAPSKEIKPVITTQNSIWKTESDDDF